MPKTKIPLNISDHNRVTIFVWYPNGVNRQVGHVSMRTYIGGPTGKGNYISFWPNQHKEIPDENSRPSFWKRVKNIPSHIYKPWDIRNQLFGYLRDTEKEKTIEQMFMTDCDANHENGFPEIAIELYSLDVKTLNAEYEKFRKSACKWSIWGSSFFQNDKVKNCCGLVFVLLAKSGIKQLVDYSNEYLVKTVSILFGIAGFGTIFYLFWQELFAAMDGGSENLELEDILDPDLLLILLKFGGGGTLFSGIVGGITGKTVGEVTDLYFGIKHIITPLGIAMLCTTASNNEAVKYEFIPKSIKTYETKPEINPILRSRL